jgi:hypothetical protein
MKALVCEQHARESTDPASKRDWEELAIEWRLMARSPASTNDVISHVEVT